MMSNTNVELFSFFEHSPDLVCIADREGRFHALNPAWSALGYAPEEIKAMHWLDLAHPEDRERTLAAVTALYADEPKPPLEHRYRRKDGSYVWLEWNASLDPSHTLIFAIARDITERKRAQQALAESETLFRAVVEAMSDGMVVQNREGAIVLCNTRAEKILGLTAAQMAGRTSCDPRWKSIRQDGSPFPGAEHPAMVALRTGVAVQDVLMGVHQPNGVLTWISIHATPLFVAREERPYAVVVTFTDVTERRALEEQVEMQMLRVNEMCSQLEAQQLELESSNRQLTTLAITDGLTGVANRRYFQARLEQEVQAARPHGTALSLMMLDVDHFKKYNDAFGHLAGDEVLKRMAQTLQESARPTDIIARYGGEEFVIVLLRTPVSGAVTAAERLRKKVEEAAWQYGAVTISVGVASLAPETKRTEELIAQADAALYYSKRAGRNCVTHYNDIAESEPERP